MKNENEELLERLNKIFISGDLPMESDAEWIATALVELIQINSKLVMKIDQLEQKITDLEHDKSDSMF